MGGGGNRTSAALDKSRLEASPPSAAAARTAAFCPAVGQTAVYYRRCRTLGSVSLSLSVCWTHRPEDGLLCITGESLMSAQLTCPFSPSHSPDVPGARPSGAVCVFTVVDLGLSRVEARVIPHANDRRWLTHAADRRGKQEAEKGKSWNGINSALRRCDSLSRT